MQDKNWNYWLPPRFYSRINLWSFHATETTQRLETVQQSVIASCCCVGFLFISWTGDNNGLCKLRFYYHMYGVGIGALRVLAADRYSQRTLWTKSYSQSIYWSRAEIPLANMSTSFYVSFNPHYNRQVSQLGADFLRFHHQCYSPSPSCFPFFGREKSLLADYCIILWDHCGVLLAKR